MGYVWEIIFSDGESVLSNKVIEKVYDTYKEAEEAGKFFGSCYYKGKKYIEEETDFEASDAIIEEIKIVHI
ncbi:MAG: hypothetical protein J6A11_05175 [Lachnospiraceae bacterium]|nr:hypothetical protein [Lachnospiraceae bacterium]